MNMTESDRRLRYFRRKQTGIAYTFLNGDDGWEDPEVHNDPAAVREKH
jgi:hypothetical protein